MVPGSDGIFNDTGQKIQKLKIIREVCGEGGECVVREGSVW